MTDTTTITLPSAIDLAAAIESGAATVTAAEQNLSWDCDCQNSGAVWPDTTIRIAHSDWHTDVTVWLRGCYDGRDWIADDGGAGGDTGNPVVRVVEGDDYDEEAQSYGYAVEITGGDNIGETITLPAGLDEEAAEHAADIIREHLDRAYGSITIAEPTREEIEIEERNWHEADMVRHVLLPCADCVAEVVDIQINQYAHPIFDAAEMGGDKWDRKSPEDAGVPTVWAVTGDYRLTDLRGVTSREIMAALVERLGELEEAAPTDRYLTAGGNTPTIYDDEEAAEAALYSRLREQVEEMQEVDGIALLTDEEGLYLVVTDSPTAPATAIPDPYHLDARELGLCVVAHSLQPAVDLALAAWSRRAASARIAAERVAEQARIATVITERDPWVTRNDSLLAGNCPQGTDLFIRVLRHDLDAAGDIGAVRASYILARRDDAFTRRAVNHAARRVAG
jgi:hypothetical protein